ncbi:MAG: hypothetical protein ACUVRC_04425 [Desulfotomaculales bacterium]
MSFHDLVRRAIAIDEEEIALWSEIASLVRSHELRAAIMRMINHERQDIEFWRSVLAEPMPMAATTREEQPGDAGERGGPSYLHHRIRQALMLDLEEIALLAEIASRVPSDALRLDILMHMLPNKVCEACFWNTVLLHYNMMMGP